MALAKGHRRGVLERGWRAGGAGGKLDVPGNCGFDGGGEADHFKYGRQPSRSADLEKVERPGVAAEAAMVGGVGVSQTTSNTGASPVEALTWRNWSGPAWQRRQQ